MKAFVGILLIANLALAAWGLLVQRNREGAEATLMESQLNADKIRIVRGEPEPAPAPPPVRADACVEWGPFSQDELGRARTALEPLALGNRLITAPVSVTAGWWVYLPPLRSRDAAERKIAELKALGVEESYLVPEKGDWENAISLGIFRSEEGAQRFLDSLRAKGVRSAVAGARQQLVRLNTLFLRNPGEAEVQRLTELRAELPGTSVKAVKCP